MARVKEPGGVGKKGRRRLQTNPGILKTTHLAWHAWVHAPTFDAVISCHNWPINVWLSLERKSTSEDAYVNPITRGRRLFWNINESERLIQALDLCLFNPPNRTVYKLPSERIQHPSKKHLQAGSSMTHCKKPLHSRTKEKSLLVIQIKQN